jgi:hypothetical protein
MRVHVAEEEGEHARLLLRGADEAHARDLAQRFGGVGKQIVFVRRDPRKPELAHEPGSARH